MATLSGDVTPEVTDLLQHLIRNACVNDGTLESGNEARSADLLEAYLSGSGVDVERYEPAPNRTDIACFIGFVGRREPFGGELVDGEVWGRGAIDMLNLTASMAVATRRLAAGGFRPEGTLVYLAVADEEALGTWGADHLARHQLDAVGADYVITESGGIPVPGGDGGLRLPVLVGEKGSCWCTLRVTGTPGHASQPYATDNALVTAAAVVQRLADHRPETRIHDTWRRFLEGLAYPQDIVGPLLDPDRLVDALPDFPVAMARQFHACTHMTIAPTVAHGGTKTNVIPDRVDLQLDIRTLPGQSLPDVEAVLAEALGDLADRVELIDSHDDPSTESAVETALWETLAGTTQAFYEGSHLVPMISVGATDARFFRRLGATAYGFGLFSQKLTFEDYGRMFHGDVESLRLSAELWEAVARDLLVG